VPQTGRVTITRPGLPRAGGVACCPMTARRT